jgi:hypothetical protein
MNHPKLMATFTWNKGATLPTTSLEASMEIPADVISFPATGRKAPSRRDASFHRPVQTCHLPLWKRSAKLRSWIISLSQSEIAGLGSSGVKPMFVFSILLGFSMAIRTTNGTDLTGLDVFWTGNHYRFTTESSRYGLDSPREFIFIICKQQDGDIEGFDFPLHVPEFLLFST